MKKLDVPSWTGDEYRLHPGDDGYAEWWVANLTPEGYAFYFRPIRSKPDPACFDLSEMD